MRGGRDLVGCMREESWRQSMSYVSCEKARCGNVWATRRPCTSHTGLREKKTTNAAAGLAAGRQSLHERRQRLAMQERALKQAK